MFSPNMLELKALKDKKAAAVLNGFTEIANEFKQKPNKSWVDQQILQ